MSSSDISSVTKEIRFAVVMYGGVSLAIYINGACQELLHLVRATSKSGKDSQGNPAIIPGGELSGTEKIYRKLSYLLADDALLKQYDDWIKGKLEENHLENKLNNDINIQTRFVVDILSGASAGGINGIHLAKALSNNQNIDKLKDLWVNEGDIAILLNDKGSLIGTQLSNPTHPESLLNSRRLYLKLLDSLDQMEDKKNVVKSDFDSPYVDQLDLFVTTTDIEGQAVPLRLADRIVNERRYRNVFHFRYAKQEKTGEQCNDFVPENNPFLAFAARCTSSFPFAFEPMRLCDIDGVLDLLGDYRGKSDYSSNSPRWAQFFKDRVSQKKDGAPPDYADTSYSDGGCLDNKPFSYAIDALATRTSTVPVERKLIYIEPSPEHPEDDVRIEVDGSGRKRKPDALENVKAALLDLPTYETIREDLNRVLERNRFINRINRILDSIMVNNFDASGNGDDQFAKALPTLKPGEWITLTTAEMLRKLGPAYVSYQRLRVAIASDELAEMVADAEGFDIDSDQVQAIRYLIRAWRDERYNDESGETLNHFLHDFDLRYELRRLRFLLGKIDELYRCLIRLKNDSDPNSDVLAPSELVDDFFARLAQFSGSKKTKRDENDLAGKSQNKGTPPGNPKLNVSQFQNALLYVKCNLNEVYKDLLVLLKQFHFRPETESGAQPNHDSGSSKSLAAQIGNLKLEPIHLNYILGVPWGQTIPVEAVPMDAVYDCRSTPSSIHEQRCVGRAKNLLNGKNASVFGLGGPYKDPKEGLSRELNETANGLRDTLDESLRRELGPKGSPNVNRYGAFLHPQNDSEKTAAVGCNANRKNINSEYELLIRKYLYSYYAHFDFYDQITLPLLFNTGVSELQPVEVIRISPEDATSLINEREDGRGRRKLAGTSLFHFGGFLDKSWRQNDIMWGRLDGAERIIAALLPDQKWNDVKKALIKEANEEIVKEELQPQGKQTLAGLLTDALVRVNAGKPDGEAVAQAINTKMTSSVLKSRLDIAMLSFLKIDELIDYIRNYYEINRDLDPEPTLKAAARATQVIGKMFENIAQSKNVSNKGLAWIARLGLIFWGLVQVAVPNTLKNLVVVHWIKLLYAFEIFTILAATLLSSNEAQRFGWTALGITISVNVAIYLLGDWMRGKKAILYLTTFIFAVTILFLSSIGLVKVLGWFFDVPTGSFAAVAWLKLHTAGIVTFIGNWLPSSLRSDVPKLIALVLVIFVIVIIGVIGHRSRKQ